MSSSAYLLDTDIASYVLRADHPALQQTMRFVDAGRIYADVRHALTTSGHPIGEMDMMIAAYALAANLILVSNNLRHHQRLTPPLQLENWTEA